MRALRRLSTATAAVAAADRVTASDRTPPPVFPRRRRAGRRPRAVATAAPRGTPRQSAMHALRSSTSAAATVAAPGLATGGARTPPPVFPCRRRAGRRPRAVATAAPRGAPRQSAMHALRSSTSAAATVAAPGLATASARTPPPVFPRRRRAGRRPRTVATVAPRGTSVQSAMRALRSSSTAAAGRSPPAPEHCRRFSKAVAAMGRPATSGAPRPIAEHPARCAARAAHEHRWRPPPSRPPPGTAPPPTAFSILPAPSHRRDVYRIRAPGQVSHITTGPRASSVFHNQHRCGKRRAADALAM